MRRCHALGLPPFALHTARLSGGVPTTATSWTDWSGCGGLTSELAKLPSLEPRIVVPGRFRPEAGSCTSRGASERMPWAWVREAPEDVETFSPTEVEGHGPTCRLVVGRMVGFVEVAQVLPSPIDEQEAPTDPLVCSCLSYTTSCPGVVARNTGEAIR